MAVGYSGRLFPTGGSAFDGPRGHGQGELSAGVRALQPTGELSVVSWAGLFVFQRRPGDPPQHADCGTTVFFRVGNLPSADLQVVDVRESLPRDPGESSKRREPSELQKGSLNSKMAWLTSYRGALEG